MGRLAPDADWKFVCTNPCHVRNFELVAVSRCRSERLAETPHVHLRYVLHTALVEPFVQTSGRLPDKCISGSMIPSTTHQGQARAATMRINDNPSNSLLTQHSEVSSITMISSYSYKPRGFLNHKLIYW